MVNGDGGMVVELLKVKNDSTIKFQSYVKDFKELSLINGEFTKFDKQIPENNQLQQKV